LDKNTTAAYEGNAPDVKAIFTDEWLSSYYWRLEQLLDRIEHSNTHYQVLDINRSANNEQIGQAYRQILALLHPSNRPNLFGTSGDIRLRIKRATERVSLAGSILLHFGKRVEYDNSLSRRLTAPLTINIPLSAWIEPSKDGTVTTASQEEPPHKQEEKASTLARDPKTVLLEDNLSHKAIATQLPIGTVLSDGNPDENRRRGRRFKVSLPVYVTGHDRKNGKSREIANTVDVSRFGIAIQMRARVPQGTVLHLTLPLPVKLRNHGYTDHSYSVYAIVRRVQPPQDGLRLVGVEFLGEHPPAGYLDEPWGTFHTTKWQGANRRREPRELRTESVGVEYLDKDMQPIQSEIAVTEDVSCSGVRIFVSATPDEFDYVKVTNLQKNCSSVAAVCNRYLGKDGFERLCLNFIDYKWLL
jgi:hypothetical protein